MLTKLSRRDFVLLKKESSRLKGRYFIFLFVRSEEPGVGFVVSRRHGGAVQRNLQKRWIRSFLAENKDCWDFWNLVKLLIVALPYKGSYEDKYNDFQRCLQKMEKVLPE